MAILMRYWWSAGRVVGADSAQWLDRLNRSHRSTLSFCFYCERALALIVLFAIHCQSTWLAYLIYRFAKVSWKRTFKFTMPPAWLVQLVRCHRFQSPPPPPPPGPSHTHTHTHCSNWGNSLLTWERSVSQTVAGRNLWFGRTRTPCRSGKSTGDL